MTLNQVRQRKLPNNPRSIECDTTAPPRLLPSTALLIGKLGAAHGVQGWIKLQSFCENPHDILSYPLWYNTSSQQSLQPLSIESHRITDHHILIKLKNVNTREAACLLTHSQIFTDKEQLPELQEAFYWCDLINFKVVDQHSKAIGCVQEFKTMPAQDIMIVKRDSGKPVLIPCLLGKHILKVDVAQQTIIINRDWCLIDE